MIQRRWSDSRRDYPMWTHANRAKYNRDHLRYPSDLTDDEWALVEPFIPPAKPGGRKREKDMRAVMDGVMYILSTGCQWRYPPKDFPPKSTVHNYFIWWQCDGVLDRIHGANLWQRPCQDPALSRNRNHQTIQSSERVRAVTQALD